MKVKHIYGLPPMYTNTYMIFSEGGHAAIVDPAASVEEYQKQLTEENATLSLILLTHGHYDHVGSVVKLKELTGCKVYLDVQDAKGDRMTPLHPQDVDEGYVNGGTIQMDELTFTTYYTPGHTRGSWCILCGEYLFTGDTLFCGEIGRTDLPGGSMEQMMQSLAKIKALPLPDNTQVLPGHEEFSTIGQEKKFNYYLKKA